MKNANGPAAPMRGAGIHPPDRRVCSPLLHEPGPLARRGALPATTGCTALRSAQIAPPSIAAKEMYSGRTPCQLRQAWRISDRSPDKARQRGNRLRVAPTRTCASVRSGRVALQSELSRTAAAPSAASCPRASTPSARRAPQPPQESDRAALHEPRLRAPPHATRLQHRRSQRDPRPLTDAAPPPAASVESGPTRAYRSPARRP